MKSELNAEWLGQFIKALHFAAVKHRDQRRKGSAASPYINHPIDLAHILWNEAGERDLNAVLAAILHDTVEDTDTTPDEIEAHFGRRIREIVEELTDDKSLPKQVRKDLQIRHAARKSTPAKRAKMADKISNVRELLHDPPKGWSRARQIEYVEWADKVVAECAGASPALAEIFARLKESAGGQGK